jgi:ABC-2 type transport system ATP-binding protein
MADVVALCKRVFVIDHGRLVYDGDLESLVERISPVKYIRLVTQQPIGAEDLSRFGEVRSVEAFKATLAVPREKTSAVAAQLFQLLSIEDITIEDPEVEEIIGRIFTEKLLSK